THLARLLAGLLARAAGLLARGRTRTRRRLARPPPGRAQTCARADEIACAVRGEGRARTCSDEGAAQLRRPGGGCAWRGPPLRSRVELRRHGALSAPAPRRSTWDGAGERRGFADAARRRPTWDGAGERRAARVRGRRAASSHVGRSRGAGSGERSRTPRGVVP